MAHALGILHAPVEVAALGYDWVAGSLQADVALEELYGLNLFLAGLDRPRHALQLVNGDADRSQAEAALTLTTDRAADVGRLREINQCPSAGLVLREFCEVVHCRQAELTGAIQNT